IGFPAQIVATAVRRGARLIDVAGPQVDALRNEYPFLRKVALHEATYGDGTIHTVGVDGLLLCRDDFDPELAYRMTKLLLETLPSLSSPTGVLAHVDVRRTSATPVPLHPGAARYFRERELSR